MNSRPTFAESHGNVLKDVSNGTGLYVQVPDTTGVGRPDGFLWVPNSFELDPTHAAKPLLVMLAGRGDTPQHVMGNTYTQMMDVQNELDAFVLGLTAKTSSAGGNSWNVSNEGCWPPADGAGPDDMGYIATQIGKVCAPPVGTGAFPCDAKKIWMWGHSCGAIAVFYYSCTHASQIAGVFEMSGFGIRQDLDTACGTGHVHVAHFHGSSDTVKYTNTGTDLLAPNTQEYVSVEADTVEDGAARRSTVGQRADQNGCGGGTLGLTTSGFVDFDNDVGGSETDLYTWSTCPSTDGTVQVWKANSTVHVPTMTAAGYAAMLNWFTTHTKP